MSLPTTFQKNTENPFRFDVALSNNNPNDTNFQLPEIKPYQSESANSKRSQNQHIAQTIFYHGWRVVSCTELNRVALRSAHLFKKIDDINARLIKVIKRRKIQGTIYLL